MIEPKVEDYSRGLRSPLAQVAAAVFVAFPMTVGFVALLSACCVYDFVKFALFERPKLPIVGALEEEAFSASLANFAQIHTPSQAPVAPACRASGIEQETAEGLAQEIPSHRA